MKVEEIERILLKAKEKGKIQNSYIIYGGSKKEREEVSLFLCGILNCEKEVFCGECETCRKIKNKTHPDIKWIIPERSVLSINEVREVKDDIFIKPYYNKFKIYIFEIEYIKEEAASSFLKIMEEPPFYGIILILSPNINFLLPTIISRCAKIYINYKLPEYEKKFEENIEEFLKFIKLAENRNFIEFFKNIDTFCKNKEREEIENWIQSILFYMRDLYFQNLNFPENFLINKNFDKKEEINPGIQILEKVWEIKNRIRYNINTKLAIENLIFQIVSTEPLY